MVTAFVQSCLVEGEEEEEKKKDEGGSYCRADFFFLEMMKHIS
jgi:hypothetical protein